MKWSVNTSIQLLYLTVVGLPDLEQLPATDDQHGGDASLQSQWSDHAC